MSNFDHMNFYGGGSTPVFVAHANKYTKEEAVELFNIENEYGIQDGTLPCNRATIDNVQKVFVRFYPKVPHWCGYECDVNDGCYSYCNQGAGGSFPVWAISYKELMEQAV